MEKKKVKIISASAIVLVVLLFIIVTMTGSKEVHLNTTVVSKGKLELTVMATGYIQPVEEVEVGTQVSGVIEKIYVDYNSHVKKGDLLAELDKLTLQEKLNQANASLASAQSDLDFARQNFNRVKSLHDVKAATDVAYEDAVNKLAQAETSLKNAKANLSQAQVNLSYAYIYSPIDGVILDRSVNTGQTVAASFNTPTLFTIAEDLTKMQVEADVDEADIGTVKLGQKVIFSVDAYSDEIFEGTVSQIRLQPTVTSNVVTYTVIVDAPNPEEKLFPGMTANITIEVDATEGLLVPVEAVNFKMTDEILSGLTATSVEENAKNNKGQYVWVKKEGVVEQRRLQTGINDGINFIAKSGLSEGEEVVLSAAFGKKSASGTPVSILPGRPGGR